MGTGPLQKVQSLALYTLFGEVAQGGMATVHLGRLRGPAGFARNVAIKRLHAQLAKDPEFVSMFLEEARLAARIQHPNVVSVHDVISSDGELLLVMEYVHGDALSKLLRNSIKKRALVPPRIAATILSSVLAGLQAAHQAKSERGEPLHIVHRDVSPQNVLVGIDGIARVVDFGVAKARLRAHEATREGFVKGKLGYMAPEQMTRAKTDQRVDIFAASVVLWEVLVGERLFDGADISSVLKKVVAYDVVPPSTKRRDLGRSFDAVVMRGLARNPNDRFASADEMAMALEAAYAFASPREVGEWVKRFGAEELEARDRVITESEGMSSSNIEVDSDPPTALLQRGTGEKKLLKVGKIPDARTPIFPEDEDTAPERKVVPPLQPRVANDLPPDFTRRAPTVRSSRSKRSKRARQVRIALLLTFILGVMISVAIHLLRG